MIRFASDYGEGGHPEVLQALVDTNAEQTPGYGEDAYTARAAVLVCNLCRAPNADVHFVAGGTQANLLAVCAVLRPHQGVIAAASGHISVHETGAIEATGHKVLEQPTEDGKLTAAQIEAAARAWRDDAVREHMVMPKLCYLSHPTEYGTLYTADELRQIRRVCDEYGLLLYVDGARMGYALASRHNDAGLPLFAQCCDAFTIGGTKVGALFGEAMVLTNPALAQDFRCIIKQRGALFAKGRLLGVQFATLFEGGENCLYLRGAAHAMKMAEKLSAGLAAAGLEFWQKPQTNQLFVLLGAPMMERLAEKYAFEPWGQTPSGKTAARFCTAWSTREEHVDALLADVRALLV